METMVNMSMATMRSTTVRPKMRRNAPKTMLRTIRPAATKRMFSAKGLLQMFDEWSGDDPGRFGLIRRLDVKPMDEKRVIVDVDDQRARRQRNRICQRQP